MDWGTIAWKIFICLLIAFILGFLVGWLLQWLMCKGCKDRLAQLEADLDARNRELKGFKTSASTSGAVSTAGAAVNVAAAVAAPKVDANWDGDYSAIKARLDELEVLATDDEEDTDEELQAWTTETESLRAKIATLKGRASTDGGRAKTADLDASAVSLLAILKKAREDKAAGIAKIRRVGYAPGIRDDLKEILGVGPVLEKTLNGMDIYTFKEIAHWDQAKADEVGSHFASFQDRIGREEWVAQCAALHKKHYGADV